MMNKMCDINEHTVGTGQHKHECWHCGCVWKHDDDAIRAPTNEIFEEAHSCPKCGQGGIYVKAYTPAEEAELRSMWGIV